MKPTRCPFSSEELRWHYLSGKIFFKHKPIALFVVIGGIAAASMLSLEARGVNLIGSVPQGIPPLRFPAVDWHDLNQVLPLAFACFLLGAVETAAVGRMFAARYGGRFDANQENLALAASNLLAGLGGGFPVSGGTSQSVVNDEGGARTPLSTALAAVFILVVVLFFSHLLSALPQPVLAAVVLVAVAGLFNLSTLNELWRNDRSEFVVAMADIRRRAHFRPAPRRHDRRRNLPCAAAARFFPSPRCSSRTNSRHAPLLGL